MNLIGKYARLQRELRKPDGHAISGNHRERLTQELTQTGQELERLQPDQVPFLETMPWTNALAMSDEPE